MSYDVERFLFAQNKVWDDVIRELKAGEKETHWMWFVFPQVKGISSTMEGQYFAISSIDEACEYFDHPLLKANMEEVLNILITSEYLLEDVFYYPDDLKFCSCMTLFKYATGNPLFKEVMEKFKLKDDSITMDILNHKI